MPTETGTAFLIDPMGHAPEVLSGSEHQKLNAYLSIIRDDESAEITDWVLTSIADLKRPSPDALLLSIVWHYVNYEAQDRCASGEVDGVLLGHHQSHDVHWITEEERKTLEQTLAAIRAGGWFGDWLALQVDAIANATHPADRNPSPLKIAATLVDCMREHEEKMEAAREMVRMRPDLLFPTPAEPPATPEPPAPVEATQPAAKQPAKARKKARRAA